MCSCCPGYTYLMQRGDAARYVILHKYGGVCLDLDTTCLVPLDKILSTYDLTKTDTLVSDVPRPGLIDTPIIISKKENPFMEFCTRKLVVMNNYYLLPFLTVYFSMGLYYLSLSYLHAWIQFSGLTHCTHAHCTFYTNKVPHGKFGTIYSSGFLNVCLFHCSS